MYSASLSIRVLLNVRDGPAFEHLVDALVADGRRVDHRDQLGYPGLFSSRYFVRVLLREARTGEDDRVDLEALKHRRELFEQLRAAAGVLSPCRSSR